ncbi:MAG: DUF1641 domain-containing protein [Halobacteriales archaeon]
MGDTGPPVEGDPTLSVHVAKHPEEVARALEHLGLVNDLFDAAALGRAAMDDEMVESLASTGTDLAMAADGMATPELVHLGDAVGAEAEALAAGMRTLGRLQREGTLDDLAELAGLASLAMAAMDDEMVAEVAATGSRLGELADTATDAEVADGLEQLLAAVGPAMSSEPEPVGLLGLARATRDPEVRAGLGRLLAIARALGTTDASD